MVDSSCTIIFRIIYFIPLGFCVIHLLRYIYKSEKKQVLTFVYSGFIIFFLFFNYKNIDIIADIYDKSLDDEAIKSINFFYYLELGAKITGYSVMCAFLCNFSKALYTLHSLDHGNYNEKGDWLNALKASKYYIKFTDFILRVTIAFLFITMEFLLHSEIESPISHFHQISYCGMGLYISLCIWAGFTHLTLNLKGMSTQYVIGGCGLFNSFSIWYLTTYSINIFLILTLLSITLAASICLIVYIYKYFYSHREAVFSPTPTH